MNLQRQLQLWLVLALTAPCTLAFQHQKPKPALKEIDIGDILSQAQAALETAQESSPSSEITSEELLQLIQVQTEAKNEAIPEQQISLDQDQLTNTAIAGVAFGALTGNPLMIGAALGYAGSHLMEGENAEKTMKQIDEWRQGLSKSVHGTIELAHETIEKEGDLTKLPEKVIQGMFVAKATEDIESLKAKPSELINELKNALNVENLKDAPSRALENVKQTLESDEFQEEMKQAPGRAFNAFTAFLSSEEVQKAQKSAMKAMKETLESEEVKALKDRASQALQDSIKKKEE